MKSKTKNQEDVLEDLLASIAPSIDEWVERRIYHTNFARIIFWMCVKARTLDFFYPKDLRQFVKLDHSRVFYILKELAEQGLLRKKYLHNNALSYFFVKEGGVPKVLKYFKKAKKTLGIKEQAEVKFVIQSDDNGDDY